MSFLTALFAFKILISVVLLVLPLMFAPAARLAPILGVGETRPLIFRLYGIAIAALLVGYGYGLASALDGDFPWGPVMMGVVSNAGATMILAHSTLGNRVSIAARAGMIVFGGIGAALIWTALNPPAAMAPLFR